LAYLPFIVVHIKPQDTPNPFLFFLLIVSLTQHNCCSSAAWSDKMAAFILGKMGFLMRGAILDGFPIRY
jgi:hypothetical protein